MKIAYDKMNSLIGINSEEISSLVIENGIFYYQLLMDLKCAMEGDSSSGIVLSVNDTPISFSKTATIISDFINFSVNQKSLITKMVGELDNIALDEMHFCESGKLLSYIESYIQDLALLFPGEITLEKLNMQSLIKGVGIQIVEDYDTLEEKILAYMDFVRELERKDLFIFVNLRCLLSPERLQLLADTALTREHKLLLIDNMEYPKLRKERRIIIDKDFCEI